MILGIVGTSGLFPRLVDALALWKQERPESEVWVQHCGMTKLPPGLRGAAMAPREEIVERLRQAEAVVCHAGTGTLYDALTAGHVPVVLARRHHLREHVNDHQLEIVRTLRKAGRIIEASGPDDIVFAIENSRRRRGEGHAGVSRDLIDALRSEFAGVSRSRGRWTRVLRWLPVRNYPSIKA